METELLKFTANDGIILHGLLFRSQKRNDTVILNVFGMTGDFFSSKRIDKLCKAAIGGRIDIFSAGNRGLGGVFPFKDVNGERIFVGTALERFEECILDISAAIKLLKSLGYKNIILLGHSTGCQKAVYYMDKVKGHGVKAVVLLAPVDDYNLARKDLGPRFVEAVRLAKKMVRNGRANEFTPNWISHYSAARFLSYALPNKPEARIFNYDSNLTEFRSLKCPILVVIGSDEQYLTKPLEDYVSALSRATDSSKFYCKTMRGADHSFTGKERVLADVILGFAEKCTERI